MPLTINSKTIDILETKLQAQQPKYKENEAYTRGKNPELFRKKKTKDPDNRIPIPLAKIAVDDMTGYAGRDIAVTYANVEAKDDDKTKTDDYQEIMRTFQEYNEDNLLLSDAFKEMLKHERTYLLFWTSDELTLSNGMLTPEYSIVGLDRMVVIWDGALKPKMKIAALFGTEEDNPENQEVILYLPLMAERWTKKKNATEWMQDTEYINNYPYTSVPAVEIKMSREGGPLFEAEKPMIDANDRGISKSMNEMDRFNALIALFPGKVDAEFVKLLEEKKIIDQLGQYDSDKWPQYMEKNLEAVNEFYNKLLDRLERLFHKSVKVVDFSSTEFSSGDDSGAARAFKVLAMEFKASEIEIYFKKAMNRRTELFNDVINASTSSIKTEDYKTVTIMKRNLPVNDLQKAQIAQILKGLQVSDLTILKIFGKDFVPDPEAEVKAMQDQKALDAKTTIDLLNSGNDTE